MNPTVANRTILRYVPAFSQLKDAECDVLLEKIGERHVAAGETLFRQGEVGNSLAIVHHGSLAVRVTTHEGVETEIAKIGTGEVTGELCCLDPAPRTATLVATTPVMVCELTRSALEELERDAPSVHVTVLAAIARDLNRRLRNIDAQIESLVNGGPLLQPEPPPDPAVQRASAVPPQRGSIAPPRASAVPPQRASATPPERTSAAPAPRASAIPAQPARASAPPAAPAGARPSSVPPPPRAHSAPPPVYSPSSPFRRLVDWLKGESR